MKKLLFVSMILVAVLSCSEMQETITENPKTEPLSLNGVVMEVPEIQYADATRSSMEVGAGGLSFTIWSIFRC